MRAEEKDSAQSEVGPVSKTRTRVVLRVQQNKGRAPARIGIEREQLADTFEAAYPRILVPIM